MNFPVRLPSLENQDSLAGACGSKAGETSRDVPLAVAIVTYNSASVLPGLLDSLPRGLEGAGRCSIIVVDNDSGDASVAIARAHPTRPTIIETGCNAGYAAGINIAARVAGAEADLLVLNPDMRLFPGSARALRARLGDPGVGAVAPNIVGEDNKTACSLRREPSLATAWAEALLGGRLAARLGLSEIIARQDFYARRQSVEWATGAALMISAEARRRAGEWDESFFLYSEEVDYLRRIRRLGLSVDYVPEARMLHIGGEYRQNPFLSALMAGNRIRDYGRHHGRMATRGFQLGIVAGEALRAPRGPAHRAALRAAIAASQSTPQHGAFQATTPTGPQRAE